MTKTRDTFIQFVILGFGLIYYLWIYHLAHLLSMGGWPTLLSPEFLLWVWATIEIVKAFRGIVGFAFPNLSLADALMYCGVGVGIITIARLLLERLAMSLS